MALRLDLKRSCEELVRVTDRRRRPVFALGCALALATAELSAQPAPTSMTRPRRPRRRPRAPCTEGSLGTRVLAETVGFYVGAAAAFIPFILYATSHEIGASGDDLSGYYFGFSLSAAVLVGSVGAWGAGRLAGGDGGFGWTLLGTFAGATLITGGSTPLLLATTTVLPAVGAVLGFELSASPHCPVRTRRPRVSEGWWMLTPSIERVGENPRLGLTLSASF